MAKKLISTKEWDIYKRAIYDALDAFAQHPVTWRRLSNKISRWGEDNTSKFQDTTLLALINYNYFRTWPISKETDTGTLDKENIVIMFSREYLSDLGLINEEGYFKYNPRDDRWIINGIEHIDAGDTEASCAPDESLMFTIILRRLERPSGIPSYG